MTVGECVAIQRIEWSRAGVSNKVLARIFVPLEGLEVIKKRCVHMAGRLRVKCRESLRARL